jgi:DNA-binding MarR family transcriptional regulator
MLHHIHQAGFPDVTYAQFPVFRYAGPEGRQPTEIAAAAGLSKHAVNDVLDQLERAGYLERKPRPDDGRGRVVRLTPRGRRLDAAIWDAGREVERTWKRRVGEPAWNVFRDVLDQLAEADSAAEDPPRPTTAEAGRRAGVPWGRERRHPNNQEAPPGRGFKPRRS